MRRLPLLLVATAILSPALSGCLGTLPAADVMTTFYPLEFLSQRIVGNNLTVASVVRPGTEPHDYEPTTKDLRRINQAKALVIQGAGFENWLRTAQEQAPDTKLITATEGLGLRENPDEEEAEELPQDPHTWVDPVLTQAMARTIHEGLAQVWPERSDDFQANADRLIADLEALDEEYRTGLQACTTPFIITNHAAFGYMAARYDFTMLAITGLDPNEEPDPKTVQRIIDEARRHNITIIFFEDLVSPRVAETIAREVHAGTRVLSPVESAPEEGDYFTVMRTNLQNLRDAMKCP